MDSGGRGRYFAQSVHLDVQYFNWRRHVEAEWKAHNFFTKYGFLFKESKFRLLQKECDCGGNLAHKKIMVGTNGVNLELCPYHFLIIIGRLCALAEGKGMIIDGEGIKRLIEKTKIKEIDNE